MILIDILLFLNVLFNFNYKIVIIISQFIIKSIFKVLKKM